MATSSVSGTASVSSWNASADVRPIVASGRRAAASSQSQLAPVVSAGRYRPRAIRSRRPEAAARCRLAREVGCSVAASGMMVRGTSSVETEGTQVWLSVDELT